MFKGEKEVSYHEFLVGTAKNLAIDISRFRHAAQKGCPPLTYSLAFRVIVSVIASYYMFFRVKSRLNINTLAPIVNTPRLPIL